MLTTVVPLQPFEWLTHLNLRAYDLRLALWPGTPLGRGVLKSFMRRFCSTQVEVTLWIRRSLEAFKKRLETRQQELRRTVNRTQADGRSADEDTAQDIADRAASSYTKEFLFSQSNNERQTVADGGQGPWRASAKAASANAFTAAKRSTPSASKPSPGRATASSARKNWSRDC